MDSKRTSLARGASTPTIALLVATLIVCSLVISATSILAQQLTPSRDQRAGQMKAESTAVPAGNDQGINGVKQPVAAVDDSGQQGTLSDKDSVTVSAPLTDGTASELFALAASYYASEDWINAIEQFKTLTQHYPDDKKSIPALFYLAESCIQTGQHHEAVDYFQRFIEREPESDLSVRASFRIAECRYLTGDRDQALSAFQSFTLNHADNPLNEFALPYLAELHLEFGNATEARTTYETALSRFPDSRFGPKWRLGLAQSLQRLGEYHEADRFYNFVAQQKQGGLDDYALLLSARMWAAKGEWNVCRLRLDALERDFPNSELNADVQYLAGKHLMWQENWEEAWSKLEPIIDKPWSPAQLSRICLDAALVAIRLEKFEEARSILDRTSTDDVEPDLKEFGLVLAIDLAASQARTAELASLVDQLESGYAGSVYLPRSIESLARSYYVAADYQLAASRYEQLIEIASDPDSPKSADLQANLARWQYLRGLSLIGCGNFTEATECLTSITEFAGDTSLESAFSFAIATSLSGVKDYKSSLPHYRKYIALLPEGPDIDRCHADLANALVHCNQLDEAIELIEPKLSEKTSDRWLLRACSSIAEGAVSAGRTDDANKYFQILSQSGLPEYATRGFNGLVWVDGKDSIDWDAIHSLVSESPTAETLETLVARGQNCHAEKEYDDAIRLFEYVVKYGSETELAIDSQVHLAIALARTGKTDNLSRATTLLQTFAEQHAEHSLCDLALYELAWLQQDCEDLQMARSTFVNIVDNYSESRFWTDSLYRAAILSRQLNDSMAAVEMLTRLADTCPDEPLAQYAWFTLGEIAAQRENWAEAIGYFEKVPLGDSDSALVSPSIYWMAECYFQKGQTAIAERHFKTLQDVQFADPKTSSAVLLRLAQCYGKRDDWSAVRELLDDAGKSNPELANGYQFDYLRSRVCMSQADFEQARQLLTNVLANSEAAATQTAAMSQWLIGESWFHQEEYDLALRAYMLCDSQYDYPQWQALALLQAAKCQDRLNDRKAAQKTIERLLASHPNSSVIIDAKQLLLRMRSDESAGKTAPASYSKQNP